MTAATDSYDALSNRFKYGLRSTIAKAGGSYADIDLFNFLLSPSLKGRGIDNPNKEITLHDARAGSSLLLLFPPHLQILMTLIFNQYEQEISSAMSSSYTVISDIKTPAQVLQFHSAITQNPLGTTHLSLLNKAPTRQELQRFLNLDPKADIFNQALPLRTRLENLFESYNFKPQIKESFIDISNNNDRYTAALYLAQKLNYAKEYIQSISEIVELWLLSTSTI